MYSHEIDVEHTANFACTAKWCVWFLLGCDTTSKSIPRRENKKDKNNVVNVIIVIYVAIVNVTSYITFYGSKKKLHNYRLAR